MAEKGIKAVTATQDFAADFEEQAPNIKQLQPYFQQVEPFLKTFDSPVPFQIFMRHWASF